MLLEAAIFNLGDSLIKFLHENKVNHINEKREIKCNMII